MLLSCIAYNNPTAGDIRPQSINQRSFGLLRHAENFSVTRTGSGETRDSTYTFTLAILKIKALFCGCNCYKDRRPNTAILHDIS